MAEPRDGPVEGAALIAQRPQMVYQAGAAAERGEDQVGVANQQT